MVQEKDPKRWDEVIIDSPFAKLTKKDVHEYYSTPAVQKKILDAVGDREAILRQSFTADKTVLRRKDEAGELIRLNKEQLDKWNAKRLSEVHPTFGRKTDVLLADIDPQEGVDWRHTKKITETVAKTMQSRPEVRDVSVRFSGGRGFYVEGKLDAPVGVDHARNLTKQILDGLAQRHDVYFQPVGPGKIRLDTTPLKFRGSIRSPYSINADTGLVSAPVKLEDLAGAQKKDFSVAKVLERMREKKAATQLPQGLLDEVSKDKWATRAYGHKTLREIKEGKRDVVPIEDKGEVVGFMAPNETKFGYPSTGFVYVAQASRGKGLAAKVLAEYAKKNPSAISFLHRDNIASQKAHQKAGWEDTGAAARGNPRARVWRVKQAMEKLAAARKEFAPGIPANRKIHKIPKVKNPQPWTLAIQKHDADKAGTHFDLRLIPPKGNKAHSWAIPKAKLPKRGVMQLAIQQPTHTREYATTFSGKIPKGTYGAGKVTMHTNEPVTVLSAGDNRVKFRRASGEQFTLFRTKEKQWGITKTAAEVIDEWRRKKREAKVTAFIRERMR